MRAGPMPGTSSSGLAVIALALVAVARHGVAPFPRPFWASRLLAGAVALAVVIIVAVSVLATGARAMGNQTASRIEAPALATQPVPITFT